MGFNLLRCVYENVNDVKGTSKSVLAYLAFRVNDSRGDNKCWPSQETIAKAIGFDQDTVRRALNKLEDLKYIIKKTGGYKGRKYKNGRLTTNEYTLCIPGHPSGEQPYEQAQNSDGDAIPSTANYGTVDSATADSATTVPQISGQQCRNLRDGSTANYGTVDSATADSATTVPQISGQQCRNLRDGSAANYGTAVPQIAGQTLNKQLNTTTTSNNNGEDKSRWWCCEEFKYVLSHYLDKHDDRNNPEVDEAYFAGHPKSDFLKSPPLYALWLSGNSDNTTFDTIKQIILDRGNNVKGVWEVLWKLSRSKETNALRNIKNLAGFIISELKKVPLEPPPDEQA